MLNTEMLAQCRTLLDESSAVYWTDAEIYSALSDGQTNVVNMALTQWQAIRRIKLDAPIPEVIRPLITVVTAAITAGANVVTLPSDYQAYINVYYSPTSTTTTDTDAVYVREFSNRAHKSRNTFMIDIIRYCYFTATQLVFELTEGHPTQGYTLEYFKVAPAISGSVSSALSDQADNAIVYYAVANLLLKDQRPQESQVFLSRFYEEMKNLLGV